MLYNQNEFGKSSDKALQSKYFKEKLIFDITNITEDKSPIKEILSTSISPELNGVELVDTYRGVSNEGQFKSGLEIVANLKLKEKINYRGYEDEETVHTIYTEHLNNISVVLPDYIHGISTKNLISQNRLSITPIVEGNIARVVSSSSIYKYIMLYLDVKHNYSA